MKDKEGGKAAFDLMLGRIHVGLPKTGFLVDNYLYRSDTYF